VTLLGVALGLLSATVFGVAAVVQARAVRGFGSAPHGLSAFVRRSVRDVRTMTVVAAYLVGFVLHAAAIWLLPLYLAQSLVAMSLPVTALASHRVEDRLHRTGWAAVAVVTLGLVLLSLGAGEPGEVQTTTTFVMAIWAGVAAIGLASTAHRHLNGPLLGLLAGLGYAGSAISVRGIGTPVDPVVLLAALAVPSFSLVAFWLYSLGMHRAAVPSTSAALIVAQTFVPAAVGVALLGDGVREGWWPAVTAGLLLATSGAAFLGWQSAATGLDRSASAESGAAGRTADESLPG
jgi:drug/metabolite transporter (DMT)-like permease